jgi:hypothetical protein
LLRRGIVFGETSEEREFDLFFHNKKCCGTIQVKKVWYNKKEDCYSTRLQKKKNRYTNDGNGFCQKLKLIYDFVLGYVEEENVWYVIPIKEIKKYWNGESRGITMRTYPHRQTNRNGAGRYEQFKNAWHLIEEFDNGVV